MCLVGMCGILRGFAEFKNLQLFQNWKLFQKLFQNLFQRFVPKFVCSQIFEFEGLSTNYHKNSLVLKFWPTDQPHFAGFWGESAAFQVKFQVNADRQVAGTFQFWLISVFGEILVLEILSVCAWLNWNKIQPSPNFAGFVRQIAALQVRRLPLFRFPGR